MPNDKPTGSVNMAYAAQSNDFTDFYVNFFNSDNTSTKVRAERERKKDIEKATHVLCFI